MWERQRGSARQGAESTEATGDLEVKGTEKAEES